MGSESFSLQSKSRSMQYKYVTVLESCAAFMNDSLFCQRCDCHKLPDGHFLLLLLSPRSCLVSLFVCFLVFHRCFFAFPTVISPHYLLSSIPIHAAFFCWSLFLLFASCCCCQPCFYFHLFTYFRKIFSS